jgi:hypothetical protein
MASILRVDTLTDASSNNSVPMATVASGSAKVFASYNLKANTGYAASLNNSSFTDVATGKSRFTFSSSLNAISYNVNANGRFEIDNDDPAESQFCQPTQLATNSVQVGTEDNATAGNAEDSRYHTIAIHGDLA